MTYKTLEDGTIQFEMKVEELKSPLSFEKIRKKSSALKEAISIFDESGEIHSTFYKMSEVPPYLFSEYENGWVLLKSFLDSNVTPEIENQLEKIDLEKAKDSYSIIDKGEFEGALVSKLLRGGCYGSPCKSRAKARQVASKLIDAIFPDNNEEYKEFVVYKFNNEWNEFQRYWTINTWSFIVFDYETSTCWLVCFGSFS